MDDYSRYIVGLELFRSQTAQSVIKVYFSWISTHAESTPETKWEQPDHHSCALAWRSAAVAWLGCQHLITVSPKPQSSPNLT